MADPMMIDPNAPQTALPTGAGGDTGATEAGQDMAVIQIPKATLDNIVGVIGELQQLLAAASDKAGSDINAQNANLEGQAASDAQMVAELDAQAKGGF